MKRISMKDFIESYLTFIGYQYETINLKKGIVKIVIKFNGYHINLIIDKDKYSFDLVCFSNDIIEGLAQFPLNYSIEYLLIQIREFIRKSEELYGVK